MSINSRAMLGCTFAFFALVACSPKSGDKTTVAVNPGTSTGVSNGAAAVTVNGEVISERQIDMILKQQHGMRSTPESRKAIIDNITMQVIVAQEAAKKGLDKAPEISDELAMSKLSVLAQAFVKDYFKTHPVSDAQLSAEYDKLKSEITGNQYKAHHILLKSEDEAKTVIAKLNIDPKSFESLASVQSLDPVSKAKGGDLGWFDPKNMVPEFGAAVAKLDKGKFTQEPVKTQFGYHVILLDDSRPNVATLAPMEQMKPVLTQRVQQQNLKAILDELKTKANVLVAAAPEATTAAASTNKTAQ